MFKRSGFNSLDDFSNEVTITEIVETTPLETTNIATYNEITITERTELLNTYSEPIKNLGWIDGTIEEFIYFDHDIEVHETYGDDPDSILRNILFPSSDTESNGSEDEKDEQLTLPIPSYKEAMEHLSVLYIFIFFNLNCTRFEFDPFLFYYNFI